MDCPSDLEIFFKGLLGIDDVKADDVIYKLEAWNQKVMAIANIFEVSFSHLAPCSKIQDKFENDRDRTKLNGPRKLKIMPAR
jgi:hypothetical protein